MDHLSPLNVFFAPEIAQYVKKNLNRMKPLYSHQILPIPWAFLIIFVGSNFHGVWSTVKNFFHKKVSFNVSLNDL